MNLAHGKRAEYSSRKSIVEHRIRLCEEQLDALRRDLLAADRELQEVEGTITTLRDLIMRTPISQIDTWDGYRQGISPYSLHTSNHSVDSESGSFNSTRQGSEQETIDSAMLQAL